MNILLITPGYLPGQGGVQIATKLIADELNRRNHNVSIITGYFNDSPKFEDDNGIKIFRLPFPPINLDPWRSYIFIYRNIGEIKRIVEENEIQVINVIHYDRSYPFTYVLKKHCTQPIVTTVHVTWHADPIYTKWKINLKEPFRRILRLYPGLWFDKKSILASDYLITISKNFEKVCKELREDDKVITIPNAIDLEQFNPNVEPISLDCKGYKILCSGRISPEKGQEYLIKAMSIVVSSMDAHLFLLGSSNQNEIQKINRIVQKYKLERYVHFISPMPYENVASYYKAMDLIVQPSTSESFGIAILENMALGNVVVASNVGGIPELIDDGKSGLLTPPANPELLAKTIIKALTDENLRKSISKIATEKAKEYDVVHHTDKLERVFLEILKSTVN
ncbi:MAG: hypothetical protein APR54_06325 [Candidatus Cloacimonas sp. SDB]|nr:MAG: hypothetical protein APR54_06325 [Candidatus Cloacimonas sp. SDB]